MYKLVVTGGNKLSGEVRVPGAKNTILPILAATIISGKKSVLNDCPRIKDVELTLEILKDLGCEIKMEGSTIEVDSSGINKTTIKKEMMDKMRSSIILTGAVLARFKKVDTSYPGGCELGLRPIDLHIKAFKELGIDVVEMGGHIHCNGENMKSSDIHLDLPSVGATENIMLVAMGIRGTTRIINAAKEPEIMDLQDFLNKIGGKVRGAGTSVIEITGVTRFYDTQHQIIPDRIVAATHIAAAAITGSTIKIQNVNSTHIGAVLSAFRDAGVLVRQGDGAIIVTGPERIKPISLLRTSPHPGFPTDSQSILTSTLSMAGGTSVIIENIFEQRFRHVEELKKMGANITVDSRCAVIKGVPILYGARVDTPDLRSGAALVIAALAAEGTTEIYNYQYIERGYEDIAKDYSSLGANIKLIEETIPTEE